MRGDQLGRDRVERGVLRLDQHLHRPEALRRIIDRLTFVAGSLAWGMVLDGYRFDVVGRVVCPAGVAVIMYVSR